MKIVHLADLHLGYRAYNRLDNKGLNIREKDVLKAFNEALTKISDINPDLIIMAGDIFHRPRPSNSTIYNTIVLLQEFRKRSPEIPIIMISGNHEAVKSFESGSILRIFESVIPRVKVVDGSIEEVPVKFLDTSVLCIPHGGLSVLEKVNIAPNKDYKYNIMAIHGTYENCPEIAGYGNGSLIKGSDINQSEWDYVAFGHYHKFTELAPNTYYAGAIERTTSNIWQEADDKKGFIEFDLDNKTCYFHSLTTPRTVIDIKRVNAKNMTGEDINRKIIEEISKIQDIENKIIRMTIDNIDPVAMREIDYKKIRELKKTAIHFRSNFIKRDFSTVSGQESDAPKQRKGIYEFLQEELEQFELAQGLDRDRFRKLAKDYLDSQMSV